MGYAMVMGEALIDLLEAEAGPDLIYRQAIGGAPLNVAVAVSRLGGDVEFAGSLGTDVLGDRIAALLAEAGVGGRGIRRVAVPTTLAVTTFEGAEPTFTFYGEPPSYALLGPGDLDLGRVAGADVLYTGSICLLREPFRSAARAAWEVTGPVKVFDPNVRPTLLPDDAAVDALRELVEEFFATADLVKLSSADALVLYREPDPAAAAQRILALGADAVVVTCGSKGAYVATAAGGGMLPAPKVSAVDATGAGDSVMGALISRLLAEGRPAARDDWERHVRFALGVAGLVCERQGGATAMPTEAELTARWT
ncbi:putative PfkB-family carbohydrate kinase [Actinoplanes missouriensis 431]|uniref:Putative PfkB-family carbohydrate kinase n=1 Tax=Actinoplanes missouriensis (strain ATCC 14538 / DSM 43046 / CBS 188.64 / JCM 3121 / NBRC 102363 / NCIMB 12654 / NRRL B-3342 / UNCC 431) TaxID=512565 RepID=I0H1J3_ACTM4|nr:carbohydrate kinase [Actinoplanes missouriensis]BAL86880.1 putative PfkB-family carbohydrate kinase [Actinoplanes missouriensis 431]